MIFAFIKFILEFFFSLKNFFLIVPAQSLYQQQKLYIKIALSIYFLFCVLFKTFFHFLFKQVYI